MSALVIHAPGDLRIEDQSTTAPPGPDEVSIDISRGGICGSDLHYFHNGGFGSVKLREPMILGHEVSGTVAETGSNVAHLKPGDKVAVNPSMACGSCQYCRHNMGNQCENMSFSGSAMRFPHQQGLFRQNLTLPAQQLFFLRPETDLSEAACAEPLAVGLHAVRRAGSLVGRQVLVSGCGPIGCLAVLSAAWAGAQRIIATDLSDSALDIARQMGANQTINIESESDSLVPLTEGKGFLDVIFECSGSPKALELALEAVWPGGTIVAIGLGGNASLPLNLLVSKEIHMVGSFRFNEEFELAADLIDRGAVNVRPIITSVMPMSEASEAFNLASQRAKSMKVQIDFGGY